MRRLPRTLILALAALALAVAGCGGSQVSAEEVPGPPPALVVPSDSEIGGSDAGASTDETTDPDAAADDAAATDGATDQAAPTEPVEPSGGTVAPEPQAAAPEDTTADPAQPEPGSPPEQFESFCEQNAGAC
jgi:hypothetical protein